MKTKMQGYKELLFLKGIKGVGNARINKFYIPLLRSCTDFEQLVTIVKKSEGKADEANIYEAEKKAEWAVDLYTRRGDIRITTILDEEYPDRLRSMGNNAPVIIYTKGDLSILREKSIAVVGTRTPSKWTMDIETEYVSRILEWGKRVIISGLASGCDSVAHKACVEKGGKTVAVLPSGFDHVYPAENAGLSEEIVKRGGVLVSEYPPHAEANQYTFVERDALIAALGDIVLVMECGPKSGTMHTVDYAVRFNKRVAAYYTSFMGKGDYSGNDCIIRDKVGTAVEDVKTLAEFLDDAGKAEPEKEPVQMTLSDFMKG